MDPALILLFGEQHYPMATATARLTVTREHFCALVERLDSGTWSKKTPSWEKKVLYTVPANPDDVIHEPVTLSYVDSDDSEVTCFRMKLSPIIFLCCEEKGLDVEAYTVHQSPANPPVPTARYKTVTIQTFRRFEHISTSIADVRWVYTLTVNWIGDSLTDAYTAFPHYVITVSMERDWAKVAREPTSAFSPDAQKWLAENMMCKISDVCLASGPSSIKYVV